MRVDVPVLRNIPILSDIFNRQTRITYLTFFVVAILIVVMYRTKFGTYVRGDGRERQCSQVCGHQDRPD